MKICFFIGHRDAPQALAPELQAAARADHLIAYVRHAASNARDVVDYAKRRGVAVCNLAETNDPS